VETGGDRMAASQVIWPMLLLYDLLVFSIENHTTAISLVLDETGHDCFNSAIS